MKNMVVTTELKLSKTDYFVVPHKNKVDSIILKCAWFSKIANLELRVSKIPKKFLDSKYDFIDFQNTGFENYVWISF